MKECDILGVNTYSDPSCIFSGDQDPNPMIYAPVWPTDRLPDSFRSRVAR